MRTIIKRVASIVLVVVLLLPMVVSAGSRSASLIANGEALGSPLLNSAFRAEDFNNKELAILGIFMSNFLVPLVDDYETCFSKGKGGSDGSGYKALAFGSDMAQNLNNMLNYVLM